MTTHTTKPKMPSQRKRSAFSSFVAAVSGSRAQDIEMHPRRRGRQRPPIPSTVIEMGTVNPSTAEERAQSSDIRAILRMYDHIEQVPKVPKAHPNQPGRLDRPEIPVDSGPLRYDPNAPVHDKDYKEFFGSSPLLQLARYAHTRMQGLYKPPPYKPRLIFLFGALMFPELLMDVLSLRAEPVLRPATIQGYKVKLWGPHPALVPPEPRDRSKHVVHGVTYVVLSARQLELLQEYESDKYKMIEWPIDLHDGGEPIKGLISVWANERDEEYFDNGGPGYAKREPGDVLVEGDWIPDVWKKHVLTEREEDEDYDGPKVVSPAAPLPPPPRRGEMPTLSR